MSEKSRVDAGDRLDRARKQFKRPPDPGPRKNLMESDFATGHGLSESEYDVLKHLVSHYANKRNLTGQLTRAAHTGTRASYGFMLELYPYILESPERGDLKKVDVCSRLIGDKAFDELLLLACDQNATICKNAVAVLLQLEPPGRRAIPELQRRFREGSESCRDFVYQAILNLIFGCHDAEPTACLMDEAFAVQLLDDAARRGPPWAKTASTVCLSFGESAVDQLVKQMQGRHLRRRRTAAEILGWLGKVATTAISALQQAEMRHDDEILQRKARDALKRIC